MSERVEDGGPAYPSHSDEKTGWYAEPGMTLRDYFAAHALAGLLSADAKYGGRTDNREALANDAYGHADAMIRARPASPSEPLNARTQGVEVGR